MGISSRAFFALSVVVFAGCRSNGFTSFYVGSKFDPVEMASELPTEYAATRSREIGHANFVSGSGEDSVEAIEAAKKVGADAVWWTKSYRNTTQHSGVIPWTTPQTAYVSGNYGGWGGSGTYSGLVTYNTTTYIPYTTTNHWFEYKARFFRSFKLDEKPIAPKRTKAPTP